MVAWNKNGLVTLFNATMWQKQQIWATLKEKEYPGGPNLMKLIIDASRNPDLRYEIYSFEAEEGLTEDMIRNAFRDTPQHIVDLIRKQGDLMFSDKLKEPVIT